MISTGFARNQSRTGTTSGDSTPLVERSSETGAASYSPGPHQKRGRGQVDSRFGGTKRLHIVLVDAYLPGVVLAVVAVEDCESIDSIGRTPDHPG